LPVLVLTSDITPEAKQRTMRHPPCRDPLESSLDITVTYGLLVAIAASLATVAKAPWPILAQRVSWPPDGLSAPNDTE